MSLWHDASVDFNATQSDKIEWWMKHVPRTTLLMRVLETVQVPEHSGDCADDLIPLAAVLVCILEAIDMAPLRCEVTSQFAPWTSVLMGIDECIDSAMLGCPLASPPIPSTSVLVCILQALQHVVLGGHATRGFVPRATVLVSVGQAADHVVLGSFHRMVREGLSEREIDQHHNEVDGPYHWHSCSCAYIKQSSSPSEADVVHVDLIEEGRDPTYRLSSTYLSHRQPFSCASIRHSNIPFSAAAMHVHPTCSRSDERSVSMLCFPP